MRTATNQVGFEVQRHDGPLGWQAITDPLDTDVLARDHLRDMARTPGAEYRVYPSLTKRN